MKLFAAVLALSILGGSASADDNVCFIVKPAGTFSTFEGDWFVENKVLNKVKINEKNLLRLSLLNREVGGERSVACMEKNKFEAAYQEACKLPCSLMAEPNLYDYEKQAVQFCVRHSLCFATR